MQFVIDLSAGIVSCDASKITASVSSTAKTRFKNKFGICNTALLNTNAVGYPMGSSAKIYGFTREGANGQMANNLIPCVNPSGIVGLYDLATSSFISPTGTFTAGPVV